MKNNSLLIILWVSTFLFLTLTIWVYYYNLHLNALSNNPENWAQFADYFGGILNPFISILNLIILTYLSIRLVKNDDERNKWTLQELAKPYGDISFDKSPWSISIAIHNCGLGPMIISEILIKDDKENCYNNFSPIVRPQNDNLNVQIGAFKLLTNCVISKDSQLEILNIEGNKEDQHYLTYIKSIDILLKNYTIEIKYQDMYERQMPALKERITLSFIEV